MSRCSSVSISLAQRVLPIPIRHTLRLPSPEAPSLIFCRIWRHWLISLSARTDTLRPSGPNATPHPCRLMNFAPFWRRNVGLPRSASAPTRSRTHFGCESMASECRPPPTCLRHGSPSTGPATCPSRRHPFLAAYRREAPSGEPPSPPYCASLRHREHTKVFGSFLRGPTERWP